MGALVEPRACNAPPDHYLRADAPFALLRELQRDEARKLTNAAHLLCVHVVGASSRS